MRKAPICLSLFVVVSASACDSEDSGQNSSENGNHATSVKGYAKPPATSAQIQSRVDGLAISAVDRIPEFSGKSGEASCFDSSPGTRPGKLVAARGWQVTGEAKAGGYQLVSFVGRMDQGTSGACLLSDGNVALFRGGDVKAILYARKGATRSIGTIEPLEPGNIRIFDGDYLSQPIADMQFGEDGSVRIQSVAASEAVCGGRIRVPNIYGVPINRSRKLLGDAGWTPLPSVGDHQDGRARALAKAGVNEVEDCSGTGFGYCAFGYRSSVGTLSVTTAGDDKWPTVAGYAVNCSNKDRKSSL